MRLVFITVLSAACATTNTASTPAGGPRGLRASEHLQVAAQHDGQAHSREGWADGSAFRAPGSESRDQPVPMPWYRSWNAGAEHERMAAIHRSEAAQLEASYDEACRGLTASQASISPLKRYAVGGWPTTNGMILYLSALAGGPDELLAVMKCHRAFMMLAPADMDDCPLDLPGLALDARGTAEGITVSLSVTDLHLVPELKRRATLELETGDRPATPPREAH
jgi:hypothetical protein